MNHIQSRISDIITKMQALDGHVSKNPIDQTQNNQPLLETKPVLPIKESDKVSFDEQLRSLILSESSKQAVHPDLIKAIVKTESNGNPNAVSKAGAIGLMQLMPGTAKSLNVDPYDPQQNLKGGITYLKQMAHKFGDLDQTLAAYNAGPGAVKKYGGVPPFQETQEYIQKIRKLIN